MPHQMGTTDTQTVATTPPSLATPGHSMSCCEPRLRVQRDSQELLILALDEDCTCKG